MPVTELICLLCVALINSLLWVPVVIGYVKSRGFLQPKDYVKMPDSPLPDWVNRANRAHMNAVENFGPFAATVLVAAVIPYTTETTVGLAVAFAAARLLHAVVQISGFSRAMMRTVIFGIGNTASIVYSVVVVLRLVNGG